MFAYCELICFRAFNFYFDVVFVGKGSLAFCVLHAIVLVVYNFIISVEVATPLANEAVFIGDAAITGGSDSGGIEPVNGFSFLFYLDALTFIFYFLC